VRARAALVGAALLVALGGCRGRRGAAGGAVSIDAATDGRAAEAKRGRFISLVYSSNDLSEYERCGCPVHPLGGLARRAAEIDRVRGESDGVLVVDAGDLFLPAEEKVKGAKPADGEVERRGRLLAAAYARMGVAAFTPGERDLALGLERLRRLLAEAKVPVVSANLVDLAGRRPWAADRLIEIAGTRIGVFGVTAASPPDEARLRAWGFVARDPAAAARDEVASLRARGARLVVALVHVGGTPDSKRLLAAAPGIDWAVLGHSGMNLEDPELVTGGARLLEAMTLGKHLGRLDLHVIDETGPFVDRGARAQLETILADHAGQIAEYEQRVPATENPTLRAYYGQRLVDLRAALERERRAFAVMPAAVTGNWWQNRILPLDTSVPDQPGVAALVAAYDRQSERLAVERRPVGLAPAGSTAPGGPPARPPGNEPRPAARYVGSEACARCHPAAVAVWKETKHARALATLEAAHRARSPECVPCHVTGYLRPGGPTELAVATARFADVGCESCHGPGSTHVDATVKRGNIARQVPASVCLGCHTPDQTNDGFEYARFLPAVVGPGHGPGP
jgi:hypothetical protein